MYDYLNGWPREGSAVTILFDKFCVGCGRELGTVDVTYHQDWRPPGTLPKWPHKPADCPDCRKRRLH